MNYLQFTDFRNNSKKYFERIENGEDFVIIRKGIPVARITPFGQNRTGWKHRVTRVKLKTGNKTTTDFLVEERSGK